MPEGVCERNFAFFRELCSRDNFGARVMAEYRYNPARAAVLCGAQCAFAVNGKQATLCGIPTAEDCDCLRFMGCDTVFLSDDAARQSGLQKIQGGVVAVLRESVGVSPAIATERITAETLRDIFPLLRDDLPQEERRRDGDWFVRLSHKLRHGQGVIVAVRRDGEIISLAVAAAVTESAAVIGCVRTRTDMRGCGFASAVCADLGQTLSAQSKQVFLCCEEKMFSFYKRIGYIKYSQWWYCKL